MRRREELVGDRDTPMGKTLYLARPIRNDAQCTRCHSTPSAAPRTLDCALRQR